MNKIYIILAISFLSSISLITFALDSPNSPSKCPPISSIQQFGISSDLDQEDDGLWTAYHPFDHYDGDYPVWRFELHSIPGKHSQEAYKNGRKLLHSLSFAGGPYHSKAGFTLCKYQTNKHNNGFLVTPIFE